MTNRLNRSTLATLALLSVAIPSAAQPAQPALAAQAAPTPAAQTPTPPMPAAQAPRATAGRLHADSDSDKSAPQAFSVVLVLGESQASTIQDNVPAAARKALADMKDFLPYKGYRLLDTQWTLCCGNYPITSRLEGAEDQEYELQLSASLVAQGRVNVRFSLNESSGPMEQSAAEMARSAGRAEQLKRSGSRVAAQKSGRRGAIIDTSFRMDVGETVVVGTSRTRGDKALIALLTAVPPKAATTTR